MPRSALDLISLETATEPNAATQATIVAHRGERMVNSLMGSTASRVIGSLPTTCCCSEIGRLLAIDAQTGVVLDRVAGELDEGFLEGAALRAELVQHRTAGRGQLA